MTKSEAMAFSEMDHLDQLGAKRDSEDVNKTVSALIKLLFPDLAICGRVSHICFPSP